MWPSVATDGEEFAYDRCGFSIWTAGTNPSMGCMKDGEPTEHETKVDCEAAEGDWIYVPGDWAFSSNPGNIVPFGDVAPSTGDDPILPSMYWKASADADPEEQLRGEARERFFNDIKPGMLDNFQFRVVADSDFDTRGCFRGSGASALAISQVLLFAAAALSVVWA
eukprot:SAG11_NODE_13673_length_644_cov_0.899083_1_plen_166_part_00